MLRKTSDSRKRWSVMTISFYVIFLRYNYAECKLKVVILSSGQLCYTSMAVEMFLNLGF